MNLVMKDEIDWTKILSKRYNGLMNQKNKIAISEFKQKCLSLIEKLGPEGLVITRHGKEVAIIKSYSENHAHLIGCLKEDIVVKGDIMSTGSEWDAES